MKTTQAIKKNDVEHKWYLIDAKGMNLGKLSVKVAQVLMGKKKVSYTANLFSGDNVIVINAKDITVSPKKVTSKLYRRHSGYPGGLKELTFEQLMGKNPATVITYAVKGMIPKTKMGSEMLRHLHIYADASYPQQAQQPTKL